MIDNNGRWEKKGNVKILVEPTKEWKEKNQTNDNIVEKKNINNELSALDKKLTRGGEDLIDLLIKKKLISYNELPEYIQSTLAKKKELREKSKSL